MFRKLVHACAGVVLMGAPAFAADIAGRFTMETRQGPLTIELHADHGHFAGTLHQGGHDYPVILSQFGNDVIGNFAAGDRIVKFTGTFDGATFTMTSNGTVYTLQKADAVTADVAAGAAKRDEPAAPKSQPEAQARQTVVQVQMQQGRFFQFPVPQGWQFNETDSGVDLKSPDGATVVSHAMLRGLGQVTPDQVYQLLLKVNAQNGITKARLLSRQVMPPQAGGVEGTIYDLSYEYHGVPCRAENIVMVLNRWGGYTFDVMSLQGPAESFGGDVGGLAQLGQSIVVTNPNGVCGNDRLIHFTPPAASSGGSSNPIGDMIVKGEEGRNRIRDNTFQRADDAVRGVTRWGADGSIVAPNNAERVFVTDGGKPLYDTHMTTPPPPNSTEVDQYKYNR